MITAKEFLGKWKKETYGLVDFDEKVIELFSLSRETKDFLIKAGFPESSPPFLTFESSTKGGGVRLTEKYEDAEEEYSKFIYVGFTGNGDPICIDEENDEVLYFDNENDNEEIFINSSISQLAESMIAYVDFIEKIKDVNGKKAFLERNATKDLLSWIANRLEKIDSDSLIQGSFWEEELSNYNKQ
ncbi:SUKH-4 family immunity protein [Paenibacillus monticola]|uniref:SUKH-4 immunity protein n=1 Tax=Paenibacillus monticola TaxID=2666075 RepID=A0A7X2L5D2_9BACL|nr:SUKH-4 family immunity protein [Paenibacillus monticola]MRN57383.1 hypothetical protein [Paenibacillus monticola]